MFCFYLGANWNLLRLFCQNRYSYAHRNIWHIQKYLCCLAVTGGLSRWGSGVPGSQEHYQGSCRGQILGLHYSGFPSRAHRAGTLSSENRKHIDRLKWYINIATFKIKQPKEHKLNSVVVAMFIVVYILLLQRDNLPETHLILYISIKLGKNKWK